MRINLCLFIHTHIYAYIYINTYVHVYVRMYSNMYTHTFIHTCVCFRMLVTHRFLRRCMHTFVPFFENHTYTYIRTPVHMDIKTVEFTHICFLAHVCLCTYILLKPHIYVYTHTCAHVYTDYRRGTARLGHASHDDS